MTICTTKEAKAAARSQANGERHFYCATPFGWGTDAIMLNAIVKALKSCLPTAKSYEPEFEMPGIILAIGLPANAKYSIRDYRPVVDDDLVTVIHGWNDGGLVTVTPNGRQWTLGASCEWLAPVSL